MTPGPFRPPRCIRVCSHWFFDRHTVGIRRKRDLILACQAGEQIANFIGCQTLQQSFRHHGDF